MRPFVSRRPNGIRLLGQTFLPIARVSSRNAETARSAPWFWMAADRQNARRRPQRAILGNVASGCSDSGLASNRMAGVAQIPKEHVGGSADVCYVTIRDASLLRTV